MSATRSTRVRGQGASAPKARKLGSAELLPFGPRAPRAGIFTRPGKIPDSRTIGGYVPASIVAQGAASGNAGGAGNGLPAKQNLGTGGFLMPWENKQ
jgi:hypothetical protein